MGTGPRELFALFFSYCYNIIILLSSPLKYIDKPDKMGRPPTRPIKLKNGFYIEVRNKGANSGTKIRRETRELMDRAVKDYSRRKDVIILGECVNGKFVEDAVHLKKIEDNINQR